MDGQQLLCVHNALDPAPSAHLHLCERERLLFVCSSTQVPLPRRRVRRQSARVGAERGGRVRREGRAGGSGATCGRGLEAAPRFDLPQINFL